MEDSTTKETLTAPESVPHEIDLGVVGSESVDDLIGDAGSEVPLTDTPIVLDMSLKDSEMPDLAIPKPTEVASSETMGVDRAREEYEHLAEQSIYVQTLKKRIDKDLKQIHDRMSALSHLITTKAEPHANQKAIISFLKGQKDLRAKRVANRKRILQGLTLDEVAPAGSKIDQAMARKRAMGAMRPNYPAKTGSATGG